MKSKVYSIVLILILGVVPLLAQSLIQQASAQFRAAEKAEAALNDKPEEQRSRADYLRVIHSYERVYLITPHTGWADNALTSIARLYEAMKDPKNAVKTLQFMLNEYPQTPFREVAQQDIARLSSPASDATVKETAIKEPVKDAATNNPPPSREATVAIKETKEAGQKETAAIENIRFWDEERSVRVIIDLTANVTFKVGEAKSPDRFFVDITPAKLSSSLLGKEWNVQANHLLKIRVAQYDLTTVRVVLDGTTLRDAVTSNLRDPSRIVVDVAKAMAIAPASKAITTVLPPPQPMIPTQPTTAVAQPVIADSAPVLTATSATAGASDVGRVTAAKPTSLGDRSLIRSLGLKLSRVVIDAGHGGHDTGSIGPSGLTEKELVLDVAKRLQVLVETQLGAEVVMTRDNDTFVPLESRTQRANEEKADLFLSIHANSSPEKSVRGVETFFLNLNTQSRDALATATRENAASEKKIHELQDLLQKIVLNDKADESRELAKHIQQAMSKRGNAGSNRGVKQAPFVVLIGAAMPSVLAEISFISNPEEEKRLKGPEYRQQIAESLFQGIKSYAETLSSTKAAN
jgi:N-acetylmuramoyl-L-alanine amidase